MGQRATIVMAKVPGNPGALALSHPDGANCEVEELTCP